MALESVPASSSDFGATRSCGATRSHQRVRKDERTWTTDTFAPYDDGHQWRKYGEKKLSNSKFPRFYYRCTYKNDMKCPATKQVQQKDFNDPPLFVVTYFNQHTCNTSCRPVGGPDFDVQSSGKAVSICFNANSTKEQTILPLSSATAASHGVRSYGTNQPLLPLCSETRASPRPIPIIDLEMNDETRSSNTGSVLSRTLLPIGQSRCIEYFHFL